MAARVIVPKNGIAAALILAAGGFITSELIERAGGLVPCELCLIQRWSVFAAALFLGLSMWLPRRRISVSGCAAAALATLTSLAAALRHVWLESHPGEPLGCLPDIFGRRAVAAPVPNPAPDLAVFANPLQPLSSAPSACSTPEAVRLGFSLADWSLAYAALLTIFVVLAFAVVMLGNRRAAAQVRA